MGDTSKGTVPSRRLNILHQAGQRSSAGLLRVSTPPPCFIPWFRFHSRNLLSHSFLSEESEEEQLLECSTLLWLWSRHTTSYASDLISVPRGSLHTRPAACQWHRLVQTRRILLSEPGTASYIGRHQSRFRRRKLNPMEHEDKWPCRACYPQGRCCCMLLGEPKTNRLVNMQHYKRIANLSRTLFCG